MTHLAPNRSSRLRNSAYFSEARARSGLRYTTLRCSSTILLYAARAAIRVLPDAVGLATSRLFPSSSPASTAAAWGGNSSTNPSALRWVVNSSGSGSSFTFILGGSPPRPRPRRETRCQPAPRYLALDSSEEPGLRLEDDAFLGYLQDELVDLVLVRELACLHQLLPEDLGLYGLPVRSLERPEHVHHGSQFPPLTRGLAQQNAKVSLGLGLGVREDVLDHLVHQRYRGEGVVLRDLLPQHEPRLRAGETDERLERPWGRAYLPLCGAPPQLQVVFLDPVLRLHGEHRRVILRERDVLLEEVELDWRGVDVRPLPVDVEDVRSQLLVLAGYRRVPQDEDEVEPGEKWNGKSDVVDEVLVRVVLAEDGVGRGKDRSPSVEGRVNPALGYGHSLLFHLFMQGAPVLRLHLVELVYARDSLVGQHAHTRLEHEGVL